MPAIMQKQSHHHEKRPETNQPKKVQWLFRVRQGLHLSIIECLRTIHEG
jgi:hypothetical protein